MKWTNPDGTLNVAALDQLEADLRAVTDSNAALDRVIKANKLGLDLVVAFRCSHSGGFFPSDFVKEWGRLYGVGCGPAPVSECLDSLYEIEPPPIRGLRDHTQLMHPLATSCAQVDYVEVPAEVFEAGRLIPAHQDEDMRKRVAVVFEKQMKNPASRLPQYMAEFNLIKKGR